MPTPEMKQQLRGLIRALRAAGRYTDLVRNVDSADWPSRSFIFEAIFAGKFLRPRTVHFACLENSLASRAPCQSHCQE